MITLFEVVSNIDKITGLDNKHFLVCEVNNSGVLIDVLFAVVVFDVGVEGFLQLEIVLQFFVELKCCWEGERIDKNISFFILR